MSSNHITYNIQILPKNQEDFDKIFDTLKEHQKIWNYISNDSYKKSIKIIKKDNKMLLKSDVKKNKIVKSKDKKPESVTVNDHKLILYFDIKGEGVVKEEMEFKSDCNSSLTNTKLHIFSEKEIEIEKFISKSFREGFFKINNKIYKYMDLIKAEIKCLGERSVEVRGVLDGINLS